MTLKRRIGLLAAAVIVTSTMVAAPAQAANRLGRNCERDFNRQANQIRCCEDRADTNKQERNCKQ